MSKNQKKILIIEDDKFLAKMLGNLLESNGYEVVYASNGREGLLKVAEKPDLVLLDIILPDLNGFDLLESIKSEKETSKVPIVIISNLGQTEDITQGKQLGAKDYIVKSETSLDDVVLKVKRLLTKSRK
ncbi:MAG: response regulator [Candidatus Buchananbacteria bacterium CG10_big_fil_rev_8_21_14_0_10_42_9]|uniref:Response regulator n=1 Tax=Candidatus Buchananbacteria bacterium CG10_big_fil_rev_8_21_14_0_10_42_9 TaxID=1974526 RepID=A0A2H0W1Y5_9BACT|nr:MAG: response regulator [Candidatus Buchananbacteria bacterium CG10_big_fil_rev_8_21_14_0_10_42_9]